VKIGVFLNWPEKCFRADESDIDYLKSLVPKGAGVLVAKTEREFLQMLPELSHAIVWHFKDQWYDAALKMKKLATPSAGRELIAVREGSHVNVHFGGFHGDIIAETVIGFILAWARGFFALGHHGSVSAAAWPRTWLSDKCSRVEGSNAVILGNGKIGRTVGEKLALLGVNIYGVTRSNIKDLNKLLEKADYLITILPSDTGTDNVVNENLISHLPKKAVVINVGRGNAVNENDLIKALRSGRIAGAYLDVFKCEPTLKLSKEKEADAKVLYSKSLPWNLICTPHSSAFSSNYLKLCFNELKKDRWFL
jgi:phosphoglycerate dehydrogenase-like enzyme